MLYAIVAVLAIILDQWLKFWVAGNIPLDTGVRELFPGVLSLVNLHNDGAAFGFLSGGNARIYFIALAGVFVLAVIVALATNFISGPVGRWSAVLVAAGGVGNCIDRVIYGYVQDMFRFDFWPDFAIFNVADVFITVFALIFILYIIFGGERKSDDDFVDDEEADDGEYVMEDEKEDEDAKPARRAKRAESVAAEPAKPSRKSRQAKYDEEFEQYKARRQAEPARPAPAPAHDPADPFAEWERAAAKTSAEPVKAPVIPSAPAAPVMPTIPAPAPKASDDFDLDDILNEFKDF